MVVEARDAEKCPACGTPLSRDRWSDGLCPSCVFQLALDDTGLEAELLFEPEDAPTLRYTPDQTFSEGDIQGERYRIRSLLGRGGMGEVWRAYDLKLRLDVALKALRKELTTDLGALETLRQEVRVSREVISPNVCRVYDLEELDGLELISMEYVDGRTLQEVLKERGPLELNEAREIASQFLAGLEAIHGAGLVHRDIKPENLMITRTGRVVVMDFGIAKGLGSGEGGLVAGTPAYMSPEQARGDELDARADLFSAGVVLAEMVDPAGCRDLESRQRIWQSLHLDDPEVSETPWSQVVLRAVAADREARFASTSRLARALEEVTLRATGDETARPYPGLSAFKQEDAEYFFGRELEVEALWKKLRRPHLLAVIGPSGAGKSSFLRAGLLPTLTDGWQAIIATPGNCPFENLARALAEQLPKHRAAIGALAGFEEPKAAIDLVRKWRYLGEQGLIILDQFEELFTQNPTGVQRCFAELLGSLPLAADTHVLLSMRDDFLYQCSGYESFRPILSDLTLLGPPTGASLRRAIVEPALRCGYRFEDESIVEAMLAEVEGERGALPMVAFAAAQLWEKRDRETGLLGRAAYSEIGGVSGALAQHAETTLEHIGEEGIPIVRELFRNLVTARGTRAARDRGELLSVFRGAGAADRVLDTLIDARLLISYELPGDDEAASRHRVEIVHESLLENWPRLVRWRTQDAEGAQLRDELRNQAELWEEHDRSEDYLWTGAAFKEYEVWRQRYPGGLSDIEEAFAKAMKSLAARRRRRRRIAATTVVLLALLVAAVTGGLWLRSEAEARRAEASKLLALAQLRFDEDPTEALALTTASIELEDTERARLLALRLLWDAPPAWELAPEADSMGNLAFSPDGTSLAAAGHGEDIRVWSAEGKEAPVQLTGHAVTPQGPNQATWASNDLLVTWHFTQDFVRIWRIPGGELVRKIEFGATDGERTWRQIGDNRLFAEFMETDHETKHEYFYLRSWRLPDGEVEELGRVDWTALGADWSCFEVDGSGWWYAKGRRLYYRQLPMQVGEPDRLVGIHESDRIGWGAPEELGQIWTKDLVTLEYQQWSSSATSTEPIRVSVTPEGAAEVGTGLFADPLRRQMLEMGNQKRARLWSLEAWPGARPLDLRRGGIWEGAGHAFHPEGEWVVMSTHGASRLTFWPLRAATPWVVDGYIARARAAVFTPDSALLATWWPDNRYRLWPLPGSHAKEPGELSVPIGAIGAINCVDSQGRYLVGGGFAGAFWLVPLDGSPPRELGDFSGDTIAQGCTVSPSGNLVVAAPQFGEDRTLRVWDVESEDERVFGLAVHGFVGQLSFADESTLFTTGDEGIHRWDLETGNHELVYAVDEDKEEVVSIAPGARRALLQREPTQGESSEETADFALLDLVTGEIRELSWSGGGYRTRFPAWDPSGEVVAFGDETGLIRVGKISARSPHLLIGHEGAVQGVRISPDGRWLASTGEDNTLRLWPMPDLDKPPLHILPHDLLIAKLKSLTNIRVVRDPDAPDGWLEALDPFPGWGEVPEW